MASSLTALKSKADRLLQQVYVPLNPQCLVCGAPTSEMHHYIPKSQSNNLRYDPKNLVPLCRGCHFRHHNAGDPMIVETIGRKKGEAWVDDLQKRRREPLTINITYLKEKIKELTPYLVS